MAVTNCYKPVEASLSGTVPLSRLNPSLTHSIILTTGAFLQPPQLQSTHHMTVNNADYKSSAYRLCAAVLHDEIPAGAQVSCQQPALDRLYCCLEPVEIQL